MGGELLRECLGHQPRGIIKQKTNCLIQRSIGFPHSFVFAALHLDPFAVGCICREVETLWNLDN
jgi:hypothetical protein